VIQNDEILLKFDVISCLNILDRCDKPFTLLKQIKSSLKPNGHLVLALVLPFKPYVEYNKNNQPTEQIPFRSFSSNQTLTQQVNNQIQDLIDLVFKPIGFLLVKWTRLPYLCEGNAYQSFYYLYDYVFILKNIQN
jgi:SAM-dependent methyltransferase